MVKRSQHSRLYYRAEGGATWIEAPVNGPVNTTWEVKTETTSRTGSDAEMNLPAGVAAMMEWEMLDDDANAAFVAMVDNITTPGHAQIELWATNGDAVNDAAGTVKGPQMLGLLTQMNNEKPGIGNNKVKWRAVVGYSATDEPLTFADNSA